MSQHEAIDREMLPAVYDMIKQVAQMAMLITPEQSQAIAREIDFMDALMPITDPTGYKKLLETAQGHRDLIAAFVHFRSQLERIVQEKR